MATHSSTPAWASQGQRSLAGGVSSPRGHTELDTTDHSTASDQKSPGPQQRQDFRHLEAFMIPSSGHWVARGTPPTGGLQDDRTYDAERPPPTRRPTHSLWYCLHTLVPRVCFSGCSRRWAGVRTVPRAGPAALRWCGLLTPSCVALFPPNMQCRVSCHLHRLEN